MHARAAVLVARGARRRLAGGDVRPAVHDLRPCVPGSARPRCVSVHSPVCSPRAQGTIPALSFIGVDEFVDALKYMNPRWSRYMEVLVLDGKIGDGSQTKAQVQADGIDNEMAFSHLDKNIVFDPHTEQMHVDGNKALIYAHLASMLAPVSAEMDAPGAQGYVPNTRVTRSEQVLQGDAPANTSAPTRHRQRDRDAGRRRLGLRVPRPAPRRHARRALSVPTTATPRWRCASPGPTRSATSTSTCSARPARPTSTCAAPPTSDPGAEALSLDSPPAGDYRVQVVNCTAVADTSYEGAVSFTALPAAGGTGDYTTAEKDQWIARLRDWVRGGGNLVLTDSALRALPEFADVPASQVGQTTVYTGQVTFRRCLDYASDDTCTRDERTLDDPLARDVNQPGSRFNTGMRRQVFEPTPLGFAIQDGSGADASSARQWDVDAQSFQAAGGRVAATSVDSGTRDAGPVLERATLSEIALGSGTVRIAGALLPQPATEHDHRSASSPTR